MRIGLYGLVIGLLLSACQNKNTEGARLYKDHCMHCHQEGGKGVGKLIPPISGDFLKENASSLPCLIREGMDGPIVIDGVEYNHEMPGNKRLTKFDIVNILNYLEEKYGSGKTDKFRVDEVEESLNSCR